MLHFPSNTQPGLSKTVVAGTMRVAVGVGHQWLSVFALALALWVVTDFGMGFLLIVPVVAALAISLQAALDAFDAEAEKAESFSPPM